MRSSGRPRRFPIGAETTADGVHFRVWAPRSRRVAVVIGGARPVPLEPEPSLPRRGPRVDGWFSGLVAGLRAGARYRFRLDDDGEFPDPASRFQPEGPHGPSEVIDPRFGWTDGAWTGPAPERQVIYELHVGAYTAAGTYRALIEQLDELARLGVTCLELMPLADFPGRFGWGYDGVNLFAPSRLYGRPDDLRALVDAAHARGLAVILDVVYNHLGPDGNYLGAFADEYVSERYGNEWGEPLNFDGPGSQAVRELFVTNARYWIEEYHLDGLRLDATQSMHDASPTHVLVDIARAVREAGAGRRTLLVAENEPQHARFARPIERGGYGLDLMWNDDFHHAARVAVTGHDEAYFTDYRGTPQELVSAIRHGFLFQGQTYRWQKKRRGQRARDLAPWQLVVYVQNHDQVANSARGERLDRQTSPGRLRAITAVTLLSPATPMLFMGQEFAASAPFLYFADHHGELGASVRQGRHAFLAQFASVATGHHALADPADEATFARCKLDLDERTRHAETYALHRDLLRLRREDAVLADVEKRVDGAVLADEAFCVRYSSRRGERLLICNLGRRLLLSPVPEPLLAPVDERPWSLLWSSEAPTYGGRGTPAVEREDGSFDVPAHATVVLQPPAPEDTR
ncbi:MAG: malto-oligosyltrehalose trehalohydrolase [Deltaproteobacteria bacterium]|nr:malto-oligosyltrehalose trehalohydrolase [Deltaproteobacteria bacterium]